MCGATPSPGRESRGEALYVGWRRPLGARHDPVPMPELRSGEDRPVRALPRPVRIVSLPHLFVHRAVRCVMGSVAVTFRIMPEDADTDLHSIREIGRASCRGRLSWGWSSE